MSRKPRKFSRTLRNWGLIWAGPAFIVVVWQILSTTGVIETRLLPAPFDVVQTAWRMFTEQNLLGDILISTQRALIGLVIGGSIGFGLGLINGTFPISEKLLDSSIQMLRNVPHLALIPLVILWFGIDESAKIFLVSLGVFFPIYVNTYHGIRTVDASLTEMGQLYGLHGWNLFWQVILPGALPSILVGLRISLGVMWLTLIVAETIAANSGIGYVTMNAREFMQTDVIVMGIVMYALLGKLADTIARLLERGLLKWHPSYQTATTA